MKIKDELGNGVIVPKIYRKRIQQMLEANDQEGISLLVRQFGGGAVNKTGYTPGTETYNNPYNIIPGGDITMEKTPFPVMGFPLDANRNVGEPRLMAPGTNHQFPGAAGVLEIPANQYGTPPMAPNYEIPNAWLNPSQSYVGIAGQLPTPECPPYHVWDEASQNCIPDKMGTPTGWESPDGKLPPEINIDDILSKYVGYLDEADLANEENYPKAQKDYRDLIEDLKGYSGAQGASSALGTLMQNPYTRAPYLDPGFADAQRKNTLMPQYLIDSQQADAEGQLSRIANTLISQGARPADIASMMAPYYADMQKQKNQLAIARFENDRDVNKDYYSFLTNLGHKNTLSDVENKNMIISAQNQQTQQLADTATDQFRNLAELRAKDVELQRMATKEYNDNLFTSALARLGLAGPEIQYRLEERRLAQDAQYRKDALNYIKQNPNAQVSFGVGSTRSPEEIAITPQLPPSQPIKPIVTEKPLLPQEIIPPSEPPGTGVGVGTRGPTGVPRSSVIATPGIPTPLLRSPFGLPEFQTPASDGRPMISLPPDITGGAPPTMSQPFQPRGFSVTDNPNLGQNIQPAPTPSAPYTRGFSVTDNPSVSRTASPEKPPIINHIVPSPLPQGPLAAPEVPTESTKTTAGNRAASLSKTKEIDQFYMGGKDSSKRVYDSLDMLQYHPDPLIQALRNNRFKLDVWYLKNRSKHKKDPRLNSAIKYLMELGYEDLKRNQ